MKCDACGQDKPKEKQEYREIGNLKIPMPCRECYDKAMEAFKNYKPEKPWKA